MPEREPSNLLDSTKAYGENWEARREGIYEQIDTKLRLMDEAMELVDATALQESEAHLQERFDAFWEKVRNAFPESAQRRWEREYQIVQRLKALACEFDTMIERGKEDETTRDALSEERDRLEADLAKTATPDTTFLHDMRNTLDGLAERFTQRQYRQQHPESLSRNIEHAWALLTTKGNTEPPPLDRSRLTVQYTPFGTEILIDAAYWDANVEDSLREADGFHDSEAGIIVVCNRGPEKTQEFREHERIHVLTGSVKSIGRVNLGQTVYGYTARLLRAEQQGVASSAGRLREDLLKKDRELFLKINARRILESIHNELLADIPMLERYLARPSFDEWLNIESSDLAAARWFMDHTVTAGGDMRLALKGLHRGAALSDTELREHSMTEEQALLRGVADLTRRLHNFLLITARLQKNEQRHYELLLAVLRPTQYHHIPGYLRYRGMVTPEQENREG